MVHTESAKHYNPFTFLREVRSELLKVDWPSREQALKLTVIVLGASLVVGVYIGGLDAFFTYLLKFLVK